MFSTRLRVMPSLATLMILLQLSNSIDAAAAEARWVSVSTDASPFDAFGFHSANIFGTKIVMFGGQNEEGLLNTLRIYDTATGEWEEPLTSGAAPEARALHSSVVVGTELMIWAGYDGETPFQDFFVLDLRSWKWSNPQLSGTPPAPREGHSAVVLAAEIVVFGGADGEQWFNDLHLLDKDQLSWSQPRVRGQVPTPREGHSATPYGDHKMIVFGGTDGGDCFNEVHEFDTDSLEWTTLTVRGEAPAPRVFHTATLVGQHQLYIFAGHNGEDRFNDLLVLDLQQLAWRSVPASGFAPTPRLCHSATSFPGSSHIFIVGGFDGSDLFKSLTVLETSLSTPYSDPAATAAASTPATPAAPAIKAEPEPAAAAHKVEAAESSLMAVWSGLGNGGPALAFHTANRLPDGSLMVFGGQSAEEFSDQVHMWDGNSWSNPQVAGVTPSPRAMHTSVMVSAGLLAGSVLVFGGYDGEQAHSDVWSLATANGLAWSSHQVASASSSVPLARQGHCSVLVTVGGKQSMAVFGGSDGEQWFQDLWMLGLEDTELEWSVPSTLGKAPSNREGHACAVIGDQMYVHGGTAEGDTISDLFLLQLDNMVWIRPDAVGSAPASRSFHTMLSLGSTLVIVGGYNGTLAEPVVHRLDTTRLEWEELSNSASSDTDPIPVFCHTATEWTDGSVVLHGGFDGESHLDFFTQLQLSASVQHPGTHSEADAGRAFEAAAAARALDSAGRRAATSADGEAQAETKRQEDAARRQEQARVRKETNEKEQEQQRAAEERTRARKEKESKEDEARENARESKAKKTEARQREAETQRAEAELKEKRYLQESAAAEKERQRQQSSDTIELFQKREASLNQLDNEEPAARRQREAKPVNQPPPPVEEPAATEEQPAAEEESVADTSSTSASRSLNNSPEQQDSSAPAKCDSESERLGQIEDRLSSLEGLLHQVLRKLETQL